MTNLVTEGTLFDSAKEQLEGAFRGVVKAVPFNGKEDEGAPYIVVADAVAVADMIGVEEEALEGFYVINQNGNAIILTKDQINGLLESVN